MEKSGLNPQTEKKLIELQNLSLDNEQSVREKFLMPLLKLLEYQDNDIKLEYPLKYPYVHKGTTKKPTPKRIDYMLSVNGKKKWVLDAKHPNESVSSLKNIHQVHSYADHKNIKVEFFAVCNGNQFAIYETKNTDDDKPVFEFNRSELLDKWYEIFNHLSVKAFQENKNDLTISFRPIIPYYDPQKKQELIKWFLSFILDNYKLKFINYKNNLDIAYNEYTDIFVENDQKDRGLLRYIDFLNKTIIDKHDIKDLTSRFVEEEEISYVYLLTNIPINEEANNYINNHNKKRPNEKINIVSCEELPRFLMKSQNLSIPYYKDKCTGHVENITLLATEEKKLYWAVEELNQKGESYRFLMFSAKNEEFNIDSLKSLLHQNKVWVGCLIDNGTHNINEFNDQNINDEIPIPHIPVAESFESDSACHPEDFIGREDIKKEFWNFINEVQEKKTDKRIFTIEGKSGYGKSSLILKLEQESQSKENIFFYQVDTRLLCKHSQEAFIVRSAIRKAIQESIEQNFISLHHYKIYINRERSLFYGNKSITTIIDYLRQNNKIIILCFDQFDYLFSKNDLLDIYKAFESIVIEIDSLEENFILGFSCRTGIPLTESIRDEWNELIKSIRKKVFKEIKEFNNSELDEYLNKFSQLLIKDKNQTIPSDVTRWLKDNFAFSPYLLRQVCSIIYNNPGVVSTIVHKTLKELIKNNFEEEFNKLSSREKFILNKIARDENITSLEECYAEELHKLETKRFLTCSNRKYTIPEIRKEYYLHGTLPEISTKYIPRMNVNGSLYAMRNINKFRTKIEVINFLVDEITYKELTSDNFWIDIQNIFYVHNSQNDQIIFPEEFHSHNQSNLDDYQIADYLSSYFQRHLIVEKILQNERIRNTDFFNMNTFKQIYSEVAADRSKENKNDDPPRLLTWLCFAGIFELIDPKMKLYKVPTITASAKHKGKILKCILKLTKQDKIANNCEDPIQLNFLN
ncbi:type I restriction enzyme HsdR N-terminal domain-containing protein [Anabaena cylindrica FACHB-243]|nr:MULTISPECIES: type I restriction enzyme HsdR N-terminal domain-containing protein [Anabaena]MBD2418080.1 type I restriction enzyme HsdR N-terminal domain-containing protein [Anabaena cylindrica FACHB-243]MBY5281925.1 type I restriction enzyme HsdR N-terminal domain-containing protein [Anabaena sp. CCAP 1446/1C]MCM2407357.1 type I restriction enzyme HsdR N-terminal domain-containing protein [Anabaena sp. CCAP 1446/1C]BAY01083.1 hypothetical protein NIES19_03130 [Anabaena cylindrica PCC 7122]